MKIKSVEISNFRKLKDKVMIGIEKELLIVGKNNTGKTSVFEVLEKFLVMGKKFRLEDFNNKVISKENFNNIYYEYNKILAESQGNKKEDELKILVLENMFPKINLDITISIGNDDNLADIRELLYEFDNNEELILRCSHEFTNLKGAVRSFNDYNSKIKNQNLVNGDKKVDEIDFYEYVKRNYSSYYSSRCYSTKKSRSYIHNVDTNFVRGLFNIGVITAQREVDDTSEQSKQNLSNAIWDFYQRITKESDSLSQQDTFKDSIWEIEESLNTNYKGIFSDLILEINENILNNENGQNVEIASDFNIEDMLKKNSKLRYTIDELVLPESYNGLGYSNMLYMFIQIITYKHKVKKEKRMFNILFIEEPESHLHPQMQSTFLNRITSILGNDSDNVYKVITTHSSYILQNAELLNIRYFLDRGNNTISKSLVEFFNLPGFSNLKTFVQKYFKINTCDLFFADKAILVEGTVERMLMPLLMEKFDSVNEGNKLSKQHITTIEVGGAYAHIFNELLDFLEVKTLIITDIDSVSEAHNSKCKCELLEAALGDEGSGIRSSNAVIKNWFGKTGERLYIKDLVDNYSSQDKLIKKSGEREVIKLTFQLPLPGMALWGRTFEEQLIIENSVSFETMLKSEEGSQKIQALVNAISETTAGGLNCLELKDITKEILTQYAFEIVDNIDKTNFALDLLTLDNWEVPRYIREGFEWLQK